MEITLKALRMKNFEGFKEKEIIFDENVTLIKGPNESGKTGVNDAFTWLLFDKDSKFNSTFDIKPQDEQGNAIHRLETEVEGDLLVDGQSMVFKKIFYEKWVKPNGEKEKVFKGNTTDHFINSVPVKKKDYDAKINGLIKEDIFKLLTDPLYFNNEYHWEERRSLLEQLVDNIDDDSVINLDDNLEKLRESLERFDNVEDLIASVKYEKKKYKKRIKEIPARIDEQQKSIIIIENNEDHFQEILKDAEKGLKIIEGKIEDKSSLYDEEGQIREKVRALNSTLYSIKTKQRDQYDDHKNKLITDSKALHGDCTKLGNEIDDLVKNIQVLEVNIETGKEVLETYKFEFKEVQKPVNFDNLKTDCPCCGQKLPEGDIEKQKEEMIANNKKNIIEQKEKIKQKATNRNKEIKRMEKSLEEKHEKLEELKDSSAIAMEEFEKVEKEIESLKPYSFDPPAEYKTIEKEIAALEAKLQKPDEEVINDLKRQKKEYQGVISRMKEKLLDFKTNARIHDRIEDLKEEESTLANKIAEIEEQEYMVEQFNRAKANAIEKVVNKKFDTNIVQFRLFETQINGSLNEVCTTMVRNDKGILVPFDSANNAGRINAGLAIIQRLSDHFDFEAPIFIDNAEGVNEVYKTDSQQVKLYVTEKGTEFKVKGAK